MADYRQFCEVCSAEIGFGGHESGCPVPARVRAEQAEMEWKKKQKEEALEKPFKQADEESFFDSLFSIEEDIDRIRMNLRPLEDKHSAAVRVLMSRELASKYMDYRRERRRRADAY